MYSCHLTLWMYYIFNAFLKEEKRKKVTLLTQISDKHPKKSRFTCTQDF